MKDLVTFNEFKADNQTIIEATNQVTGKIIDRYKLNPGEAYFFTKGAQVRLTTKIIVDMVQARYNNYKYSSYSEPRTMKALDRLILHCSTLATFTTPESQKAFIKRVILPDLYIINPRNPRFKLWPRFIALIEDNQSAVLHTQNLDIFSQKPNI